MRNQPTVEIDPHEALYALNVVLRRRPAERKGKRLPLAPNQLLVKALLERYHRGNVAEMAAKVGRSEQAIYLWLRTDAERRIPGTASLQKLLDAYKLDSFEEVWGADHESIYFQGQRYSPDHPAYKLLQDLLNAGLHPR